MSTPPTTNESPPADIAAAAPPRLAIWHFMVWTALVAALMAIDRDRPKMAHSPGEAPALRVVWAMTGGAALGGLLLLAARRWRGMRFPTEPGEWLLVVQGLQLLANLCLVPEGFGDGGFRGWPMARLWMSSLAVLALGMLPLVLSGKRGPWQWCFAAYAVMSGSMLAVMVVSSLELFDVYTILLNVIAMIVIATAVILLVAVAHDRFTRTPRGWVHWTGVASLLLSIGSLVWQLFSQT